MRTKFALGLFSPLVISLLLAEGAGSMFAGSNASWVIPRSRLLGSRLPRASVTVLGPAALGEPLLGTLEKQARRSFPLRNSSFMMNSLTKRLPFAPWSVLRLPVLI